MNRCPLRKCLVSWTAFSALFYNLVYVRVWLVYLVAQTFCFFVWFLWVAGQLTKNLNGQLYLFHQTENLFQISLQYKCIFCLGPKQNRNFIIFPAHKIQSFERMLALAKGQLISKRHSNLPKNNEMFVRI